MIMLTAIDKKQYGFSLIELAVVLVIMGFILSSVVGSLSVSLEGSKIKNTNERLQQVKKALLGYYALNQRFPCPATETSLGKESPSPATLIAPIKCNQYRGYVPIAELGVKGKTDDKNRLLDAWGGPIFYVITPYMNSEDTDADNIVDENDTDIDSDKNWDFVTRNGYIAPSDPARLPQATETNKLFTIYSNINSLCNVMPDAIVASDVPIVIFSRGKNANGGAGTFSPREDENMKHWIDASLSAIANNTFINTPITTKDSACGYFDDIVEWVSLPEVADVIK